MTEQRRAPRKRKTEAVVSEQLTKEEQSQLTVEERPGWLFHESDTSIEKEVSSFGDAIESIDSAKIDLERSMQKLEELNKKYKEIGTFHKEQLEKVAISRIQSHSERLKQDLANYKRRLGENRKLVLPENSIDLAKHGIYQTMIRNGGSYDNYFFKIIPELAITSFSRAGRSGVWLQKIEKHGFEVPVMKDIRLGITADANFRKQSIRLLDKRFDPIAHYHADAEGGLCMGTILEALKGTSPSVEKPEELSKYIDIVAEGLTSYYMGSPLDRNPSPKSNTQKDEQKQYFDAIEKLDSFFDNNGYREGERPEESDEEDE